MWRLGTQDEPDCLFFQKMADHGHYGHRRKGSSRQGIYVFTPDGEFLASINDVSPIRVLEMIKRGLEKWEQLPDSRKRAEPDKSLTPKHRFEQFYPRDGLVLHIYTRDLPKSADPSTRLTTRNRDTAWFSKSEVAEMIPADASVGDTFDFSYAFVERMARYHFVDNVKGQTEDFTEAQTASTKIKGRVIRQDDQETEVVIFGKTLGQVPKNRRSAPGVETELIGGAVLDKQSMSFSKFEIVAVGRRWGRTRFNDRHRQLHATPIGYVFQLAPADATPSVPGIIWSYDAPWIKGPR